MPRLFARVPCPSVLAILSTSVQPAIPRVVAQLTGEASQNTVSSISQPIDMHVERSNAGRQNNTKAYNLDDTRRTVAFTSSYADDHALVLPG